jgi:uncharacterized protein
MFPVTGTAALALSIVFGAIFGFLLHRGRVADYSTIVNQFRLRDFTVIKIMLTAIIVGGVGVLAMKQAGLVQWHIKDADLLAVALGAGIFGIGMVVYGYCPGTALAAIGGGSLHALVGAFGMIAGAVAYAFSFDWVKANIIPVGQLGKVRLPDVLGLDAWTIFAILTVIALAAFVAIEKHAAARRLS